jgi:hypothetical protein
MEWRPVWGDDDAALARDVRDRQLVDTSGVQVARAADAYLLIGPRGWELAGIDEGLLSFGRKLVTRRRGCPPPDRVIDWAQLQAFVPRFTDTTTACESAPTTAAGPAGSRLQLGDRPARQAVMSALSQLVGTRRLAVSAQVEDVREASRSARGLTLSGTARRRIGGLCLQEIRRRQKLVAPRHRSAGP